MAFGRLSAEIETVVQAGDTLQITLSEDAEFSFKGVVDSAGRVNLPCVGDYLIAGQTLASAKQALATQLEESYYWKASPVIAVLESAPASLYVYGAVQNPGLVSFGSSGELSLAQALAGVKGLTSWADVENAYILRPTSAGLDERIELNLRDQLTQRDKSEVIHLMNNDELYILGMNNRDAGLLLSNDPREVVVVGQVNAPGVVKFAPGEDATLMRAVFKAGGLTRFARGDRIKLIRYSGKSRTVEEVNLDIVIEEGFLDQDRSLLPGDMIIVPQKFINL